MYLELCFIPVIGLAAYSHYRSGLWSALLTLWVALVAGAVAFGLYLPLSSAVFATDDPSAGSYYWGDGLVLLLLFGVSFGALRIGADQVLRNRMTLPAVADTVGGGVLGAMAGYLGAGLLAVFAQMLPLPATSVMGYKPFDPKTGERADHLATRADDFVLGLYDGLFAKALSGREAGLAASYTSRALKPAGKPPFPFRGRGVDDILYHYFRRRFEYAMVNEDGLGVYARKAVPTMPGRRGTYQARRAEFGTEMRVERAWVVPELVWLDRSGRPTVRMKPSDFEWMDSAGVALEEEDVPDGAGFLFVDVTFRPDAKEGFHMIQLRDWHLDSNFREKEGRIVVPKLVGAARKAASDEEAPGSELVPLAAEAEGDEPSILDAGSVTIERSEEISGLPDDADRVFVARSADWIFETPERKARATLVFLVPSMTRRWHYGLMCGYRPRGRSGGKREDQDGLFRDFTQKLESLEITVEQDARRERDLPEVGREAAGENELLVVQVDIEKTDEGTLVVSEKNLVLTDIESDEQYSGELFEEVRKDDEELEPRRKTRDADILASGAKPVMDETGRRGYQLSPQWQMYFQEEGAEVRDTLLVFEVPRGKPLTRFRFKRVGEPAAGPPEWFLLRNMSDIRSRTHFLELEGCGFPESIKVDLGGGRVREVSSHEASGLKVLTIGIALRPKEEGDKGYYRFPLEDVELRATRGAHEGRETPMFALRFGDEEVFHRPKKDEVLTIEGERRIEFAFYTTRKLEEMRLSVSGFGQIDLVE